MIKINKKFLEQFNPCKDRFDNFLKEYPGWDGTLLELMELDRISAQDKFWVFTREIPELISLQREFALICACRAVGNNTPKEVQNYLNLILLMFEMNGVDTNIEQLKDENYCEAYWAAVTASDRAAGWAVVTASDRVAGWAAGWAVRDSEYCVFVEIIKNLLEGHGTGVKE